MKFKNIKNWHILRLANLGLLFCFMSLFGCKDAKDTPVISAQVKEMCPPGVECDCCDGIDNNNDGLTDRADKNCTICPKDKECDCCDGIDNDKDNLIDHQDSDCKDVKPNSSCCQERECAPAAAMARALAKKKGRGESDSGSASVPAPANVVSNNKKNKPAPAPVCGNGVVEDPETCDDGTPLPPGTVCSGCMILEVVCNDLLDNDGDHATDCGDAECDTLACDDSNTCTTGEICMGTACEGTAVADNTPCNDGLTCTSVDICTGGVCSSDPTNPVDCTDPLCDDKTCSDGNDCTNPDTCSSGACQSGPNVPNGSLCDQNDGTCTDGMCHALLKADS